MDTSLIKTLDHIAIPCSNIEKTINFYSGLGFSVLYRTFNEKSQEEVAFLSLNDGLVIETYQINEVSGKNGAVDHFALRVDNIDNLFAQIVNEGYEITTNGIESLPFWENGVRFFKIAGPDRESIEFLEKL